MEPLLKRISGFVFSYHKAVIIVFALLTVVSVVTVSKMEIVTDIIDVLPEGNRTVAEFRDFMTKFGAADKITFIIEPESGGIEEHTGLIEELAEGLKKSALIESVDYSAFTGSNENYLRHFPLFLDEAGLRQLNERLTEKGIERQVRLNFGRLISPLSSPADSEIIDRDPLMISGIVMENFRRQGRFDNLDLSAGYYFAVDRSTAFVFAKPKGKSRDVAFVKELKKETDSIIASVMKSAGGDGTVNISVTGGHILSEEAGQVIRHDIVSSSLISVVLIAFLIWLVYRVKAVVVLAIGFTMLSCLSMTLAFAYLMFGSLNIVTSIVAAVLIGLYVDYSMNMTKRFGDELKKTGSVRSAADAMLEKTGSAIVISALTTSLSFFSIVVTRFEGLYELGLVSGAGVIFCLITNLFLFSSLLISIGKRGDGGIYSSGDTPAKRGRAAHFITGRAGLIAATFAILVALSVSGALKLRFENDPEKLGYQESKAFAALKLLNRKMNKNAEPLILKIKADTLKGLTGEFDKSEKLLSQWKQEGIIGGYESPSVFLPPPHLQKIRMEKLREFSGNRTVSPAELSGGLTRAMDQNGIVYKRDYIDAYSHNIARALNSKGPLGFQNIDGDDTKTGQLYNRGDASFVSYIYPEGNGWDKGTLSELRETVKQAGGGWILLGTPVLFDEIKASIIKGSSIAVFITLILNVVIIYFYCRRMSHIALTLLPLAAGFILTAGFMGLCGLPFNFINIGTVALIFGFGVDYGIYVMQAYLKEEKRDIGAALDLAGKNVFMCAATTVAGCGSLLTAKFAGIASIGVVLTVGSVSCAAAALLLLPAVLHLNRKRL